MIDFRWSVAQAAADEVAIITIESVKQITISGAKVNGQAERVSGSTPISEKGTCWSQNNNPSTSDDCSQEGEGEGTFTTTISGLSSATSYYVRTYATNNSGTAYSDEQTFTTGEEKSLASVSTSEVNSVSETSAQSGGNVTDDGNAEVTERGICWDTSENPTSNDNCTSNGSGTGSFTSNLTSLSSGTQYYVRAYATNSEGTAYGNQRDFRTENVQTYSIFGVVAEDDGTAIQGLDMLLIRHNQDTNLSTTTDNSGYYIFQELKAGDDYSVAPQSFDDFEPTNQRFENLQTDQTQDFQKIEEYNDCPSGKNTEVVDVTNLATGQTWMDRNLGACRAATSSTDEQAYGDIYQWGRATDGHQKRNSSITSTTSSSDQPGHGDFIITTDEPQDWRSPQNDNLWQGLNGINNPCPNGYRIPTSAELDSERKSWSTNNKAGAFDSPLKLPLAGFRDRSKGGVGLGRRQAFYWSSIVDRIYVQMLVFDNEGALIGANPRGTGFSVRCIKD